MKIAIQGYEGCYHQIAAENYIHDSVTCVPCKDFRELVKKANKDKTIDGAIMAIENSIVGSIIPNYNHLLTSNLKIVGEIYTRINHQLLAKKGQKIENLREVHSHPMAIEQCRNFFDKYPKIQLIQTLDTALSAKQVMEMEEENIGAIASRRAAEIYHLDILGENIETIKKNYTRFLILSREHSLSGNNANKASLHFKVAHESGSLYKVLEVFNDFKINLSKLQSFPDLGKIWKYFFHCDIEFEDRKVFEEALNKVDKITEKCNILGIYAKGKTIYDTHSK